MVVYFEHNTKEFVYTIFLRKNNEWMQSVLIIFITRNNTILANVVKQDIDHEQFYCCYWNTYDISGTEIKYKI